MSVRITVGPVARAKNGVIGRDGRLPWRLRSDLQIFKRLTMGKPVIMGRLTWKSLPLKPLPGRTNIILSRDPEFSAKGSLVCETFTEAVQIAREQAEEDGVDEVCVIGGAELFRIALPKASRIYLTEVDAAPEGDVTFPEWSEAGWREIERESHPASETDDHAFTFRILERG